jgi:hypothetical protein
MSMFSADDVTAGSDSKYQTAGVSEKVTITEVVLIESNGIQNIQLKTINEQLRDGQSKRLSLKTEVSPGKTMSAWKVTARYLINIIMSATGKTLAEAQEVLNASSVTDLKSKLENTLIGKPFRGLFSSREYQPNKFAIELYITEPIGGTRLAWDPINRNYNSFMPKDVETSTPTPNGLPF